MVLVAEHWNASLAIEICLHLAKASSLAADSWTSGLWTI